MRPLGLALALALALAPTRARAQVLARLPSVRTTAALTSADAATRREAAERLAFVGTHDRIAEPLRIAIEHEAVPEVLAAMITTLARRADESDLPALEAAWDRASVEARLRVIAAEDAIGGEVALGLLRRHLLSGTSVTERACEAFVRTQGRVAWLASMLDDAAGRLSALECLTTAPPSAVRDAALLRAGLDTEPTAAAAIVEALVDSTLPEEALLTLAELARTRSFETSALAIFSRHAPDRVPVELWRTLLRSGDDRERSALRALRVLDPAVTDATLDALETRDEAAIGRAIDVLVDVEDLPRLARLADVPSVRMRVLDALASADGGDALLAALPRADDVDLALALSDPSIEVRAALSERASSPLVPALTGTVAPAECGPALAGAVCLALLGAEREAATAIGAERDPAAIAWLALAARHTPVDPAVVARLVSDRSTRLSAIVLVPEATTLATPRDRRALLAELVHAASDDDARVRAEAVHAIGRLADPAHRALVLRALEDGDPQVRLAAAHTLAALGALADARVVGRTHLEADARVRAALRGETPARASHPLVVRVTEHDPALAGTARVTLLLADGRVLSLAPLDGVVIVPEVPDAPAIARLETAGRD